MSADPRLGVRERDGIGRIPRPSRRNRAYSAFGRARAGRGRRADRRPVRGVSRAGFSDAEVSTGNLRLEGLAC